MRHYRLGFTLIELLVVIAIIGILSAVVVASLNTAKSNANEARRLSDIRQIRHALELYANDHGGAFPSTSGTIVCLGMNPAETCWGGTSGSEALNAALAPYLSKIPRDPISSRLYNAYTYRSNGTGNGFCYSYPDAGGTWFNVYGYYGLSWKPTDVDATTPTQGDCSKVGGIWGAWDQAPGATHCPAGGSCRQCGICYQ